MRHRALIMLFALVLMMIGAASAQEVRSEISVQGTGFFPKDETGNSTLQRSTESGGFLAGYRYHINRWLATGRSMATVAIRRSTLRRRDFLESRPTSIRPRVDL